MYTSEPTAAHDCAPSVLAIGRLLRVTQNPGTAASVAALEGDEEGSVLGGADGSSVGSSELYALAPVGESVGESVGVTLGASVGINDGCSELYALAPVGPSVGESVGESVGCKVGCMLGDKLGTAA